jgi:mannose-6-phosphate isomerase-like protein (cupin superfamily)
MRHKLRGRCGSSHTHLVRSWQDRSVALLSGRRRSGGPLTSEAFESDLWREGFDVLNGGQQPGFAEDMHAHHFDARIMVLAGEITVTRDGKPDVFHAGDHCEIPAGCQHMTKAGPEGVAYIVGKAWRRQR